MDSPYINPPLEHNGFYGIIKIDGNLPIYIEFVLPMFSLDSGLTFEDEEDAKEAMLGYDSIELLIIPSKHRKHNRPHFTKDQMYKE